MVAEDESPNSRLMMKQNTYENLKFEDIMDPIGGNGKFLIRFSILFNCFSVFVTTMSSYSKMLAVVVQDHWCHVPGREVANVSTEIWKNITIPSEDGLYSKCMMYKTPGEPNETIPCNNGWEYDNTWLSVTAASQEDWVCDKGMYPSNVLSMGLFVSVPFGILFFYAGDRLGRRKQFFFCLLLIALFRSLLPISSSVYPLYIILSILPEAAFMPCRESTLAVGIELSSHQHRSAINFISSFTYSLGIISIALTAWLLKNWVYFILISSLPCFIPLFFHRYMLESPRWLVGKGCPEEALRALEIVAKENGKQLPPDTLRKLKALSIKRSSKLGIKSIFTNKKILRNTVLLLCARSASGFTTFNLLFSNQSFGDNPFLAFIGQGILQLPAISMSHYAGNWFGRRCSHCVILISATATSVIIVWLITVSYPQWMVTAGSMTLLFFSQASESLTNLQSMEIHPTCIRQISMALEYIVLTGALSITPYSSYLGTAVEMRYMFGLIAIVLFISTFLVSFLPESLNENLPETLEDATLYGFNQKYWGLPRKLCK